MGLKDYIKTVNIGTKEPENFINQSALADGRKRLQDAGVKVILIAN